MELAFVFFVFSVFFIGFSIGFVVGKLYERGRPGFETLMYKGEPVITDPEKPSKVRSVTEELDQIAAAKAAKKKPTRSKVMKYPTPEDVRKEKDQKAMNEQIESMKEPRESSSDDAIVL